MAFAAEPTAAFDYKAEIKDQLALKVSFAHSEYGVVATIFSKPARVLVGDKRQQRLAVRCSWAAGPKSGGYLLLFHSATFLIDAGLTCEVPALEKVDWIDGEPGIDKDQPNQPSDPTLSSGTSPAVQEPRRR